MDAQEDFIAKEINHLEMALKQNKALQSHFSTLMEKVTKSKNIDQIEEVMKFKNEQLLELNRIRDTFVKPSEPFHNQEIENCSAYESLAILYDTKKRNLIRNNLLRRSMMVDDDSDQKSESDHDYITQIKDIRKVHKPSVKRYRSKQKKDSSDEEDQIQESMSFYQAKNSLSVQSERQQILMTVCQQLPSNGNLIKWHQLPQHVNYLLATLQKAPKTQEATTPIEIFKCWLKIHDKGNQFTPEEEQKLVKLVNTYGQNQWAFLSRKIRTKTSSQLREKWYKKINTNIKKRRWTPLEDLRLIILIDHFGAREWFKLASYMTNRTEVQLRERWCNVLMPTLERKDWDSDEDQKLYDLYEEHRQMQLNEEEPLKKITISWSLISSQLKGRTDNECRRRVEFLSKQGRLIGKQKKMEEEIYDEELKA